MKNSFLFCLMLFGLNTVLCQDDLRWFLSEFNQEESVKFQTKKVDYFSSNATNLPFIEKLEFRTETNDFDFRKQEYLLRVSPNSLQSIKTHKQFQQTVKYQTEMELEAAQNDAIRKRYDLIINYQFKNEILAIKLKQKLLLKDKVTLLKRSISLVDFDIMELIGAEDDAQKNNREVLDLENEIASIENVFKELSHSKHHLVRNDFPLLTIEKMKENLSKLNPNKLANHPILKVQSAIAYNRLLEYEWEAAKSKIALSFFQTKYAFDPDSDGNLKKSISIGFGFDIPFKSAGRLELNEKKIEIFESESLYRELKSNLIEQKFNNFNRLNNLIEKYELVSQQLQEGQAEYVLREYQKIAEAPPKAIVKLRENTLQTELLLKKLAHEIMLNYIEYLDISGILLQKPLKNYLSPNSSLR